MIVLVGKTCSGKNTIMDKMINDYGYKKIITYTTRPMRDGEINHETYHFIPLDEFLVKYINDFFLEVNYFNATKGIWFYGSAVEDYQKADDKTIVIVDPNGLKALKYKLNNFTSFYINVLESVIEQRQIKRHDEPQEAERRRKADNKDFETIVADVTIDGDDTVENICKKIVKYMGGSD